MVEMGLRLKSLMSMLIARQARSGEGQIESHPARVSQAHAEACGASAARDTG
jgi:hypothetical protein